MIEPDLLLQGYRLGVFPMAMEDDSIGWFSPDPRAIIPMEDFHVPHALRRALRKHFFEVKIDNAFSEVIEACARREDTWINREIIESYTRLHELGYAHSVEAWSSGKSASSPAGRIRPVADQTDSSRRTAGELRRGSYGGAGGRCFFGGSEVHSGT